MKRGMDNSNKNSFVTPSPPPPSNQRCSLPFRYPTTGSCTPLAVKATPSSSSNASASSPEMRDDVRHSMQDSSKFIIPPHMDSFVKFFAIMLRSSVEDYVNAASTCEHQQSSLKLWNVLCQRANLTLPTERIRPYYYGSDNAQTHFNIRAALVLEEAREALSRGLCRNRRRQDDAKEKRRRTMTTTTTAGGGDSGGTDIVALSQHQLLDNSSMLSSSQQSSLHVIVKQFKQRDHGITFVTFQNVPYENGQRKYFTDEEKLQLLSGQVMECCSSTTTTMMTVMDDKNNGTAIKTTKAKANVIEFLGCILPCSPERIHKFAEFDVLFFDPLLSTTTDMLFDGSSAWTLTPVDSFIGPCRQFEALSREPKSVPFLKSLLGVEQYPPPVADEARESSSSFATVDYAEAEKIICESSSSPSFAIPSLNENQEKAVSSFIQSPPKSITIVQGPPGTGKTSLLVATICRYLSSRPERRLVVCAPTNKAVSVLATRFLNASSDLHGCTVNMVLIGDDEKLLESRNNCPLRPYFVYSWHTKVLEELAFIRRCLDPKRNANGTRVPTRQGLVRKAVGIRRRIFNSLPTLPGEVKRKLDDLCEGLSERKHNDESLYHLANVAYRAIFTLPCDAWQSDLMGSADVIFCTLCSSASKVMYLSRPESIEALIVDEAAAATEPDLYIPLHLAPSRLLIVGDPKQLPSTVLSDRAKLFGLDVSLQESLMNHCNYDYIMLNVQYRMNPEISAFPSRRFYSNKVVDSNSVSGPTTGGRTRLLDGRPYVFLQVSGIEHHGMAQSVCNEREALAVVDLVKSLEDGNDQSWHCVDRIRVITFYTAQVLLLRKKLADAGLEKVLVATVDSSQGCEADVVIISLVRSSSAGFLKDDRRVNVALTRARHQLVCVGNISCFPSMVAAYTLHDLAGDARKRNAIVDLSPQCTAKRFKSTSHSSPSWIPAICNTEA